MNEATAVEIGTGREVAERLTPNPVQPMRAFLDRAVSTFGDRPALRFKGQVTSYAGFSARIDEATAVLRRLGAGPGVRIGLMLPSCPAVPVYMYAAFATGANVVPFDPEAPDQELAGIAKAGRPNLLVTCDLSGVFEKALSLARLGGVTCIVVVPFASMLPMASAAKMRLFSSEKFARPPLEFACPIYQERELLRDRTLETVAATGTGAMPRPALLDDAAFVWCAVAGGVMRTALLTQAHLASNLVQVLEAAPALTQGQERIVAALPLWHPLVFTLAVNVAVAAGAELMIVPDMTGQALGDAVRRGLPTIIMAPAPLIAGMVDDPDIEPKHFSSLRLGLFAGGSVAAALPAKLAALTPAPWLNTYGFVDGTCDHRDDTRRGN